MPPRPCKRPLNAPLFQISQYVDPVVDGFEDDLVALLLDQPHHAHIGTQSVSKYINDLHDQSIHLGGLIANPIHAVHSVQLPVPFLELLILDL